MIPTYINDWLSIIEQMNNDNKWLNVILKK